MGQQHITHLSQQVQLPTVLLSGSAEHIRGGASMAGDSLTRRSLLRTAALGIVASVSPPLPAVRWSAGAAGLPAPDPLLHLVNRITFGFHPETLARARQLGYEGFVEEQLHPERIDDSEVEAAVRERFPTLAMAQLELERFHRGPVAAELKAATVYRAVYSRRQLFEMMVDFWSNHFNVHHNDGPVSYFKTIEDRELIRPHALGRFRDLLHGSAKSPAMITYLDNFFNLKESPNENYARELMELHTLGVDGGFTQEDVEEVARAFTGWSLERLQPGGRHNTFAFQPGQHDGGARSVLGAAIPAGIGVGQGERVLDLLAEHPSCARFLAFKLCRRFVADEPPPALVEKVATRFTASGGDIRETMRALLLADEFRAAADRKLKRPLELLVSALRALGARISAFSTVFDGSGPNGMPELLAALHRMGQLPFDWAPPNGYPDVAAAWGNTTGLLDRWNLALALGGNTLPGVEIDLDGLTAGLRRPTPTALADHLTARLLARSLTPPDRRQVIRHVAGAAGVSPTTPVPQRRLRSVTLGTAPLLLSSPYFQWR
jgi:uncharacterized protein (DUF1800 family)